MANLIRRREGGGQLTSQRNEWDPFRMMREMLRWDPFQEMLPFAPSLEPGAMFLPDFEVKETKDGYLFKADLPGVKEDDLEISLTGNRLVVSGKREVEKQEENETYFARERSYGTFTRTFTLPEGADVDHAKADLKNGVLTLVVPKKAEMQPRRIEVKPGTEKGQAKA
jgi:HSP20 family protein